MYLAKEMIQRSFTTAMQMLYDFDIVNRLSKNHQANSPIKVEDITSKFNKEEFENLARPYFEFMVKIPIEKWGNLAKVRIAYQCVMMSYESQEKVAA